MHVPTVLTLIQTIVPLAVDALNFCSVLLLLFLKEVRVAKTKFAKISNKAEVKELAAASNWIYITRNRDY